MGIPPFDRVGVPVFSIAGAPRFVKAGRGGDPPFRVQRVLTKEGGAERKKHAQACFFRIGADYGARTRHLDLGKVALYQMS